MRCCRGLGRAAVRVTVCSRAIRIVLQLMRGSVKMGDEPIMRVLRRLIMRVLVTALMIMRHIDRRMMRRPQVIVRHPMGERRARSRQAREQRQDQRADARTEGTGVGHA